MTVQNMMASSALIGTPNVVGIRDRVASFIKVAPDRQTKDLLRDILNLLDRPYNLEWVRDEYKLSPAEFRVLTLIVEGKTPKAISEATGTQISTVRVHVSKIYRKMKVANMAELTSILLQRARFI